MPLAELALVCRSPRLTSWLLYQSTPCHSSACQPLTTCESHQRVSCMSMSVLTSIGNIITGLLDFSNCQVRVCCYMPGHKLLKSCKPIGRRHTAQIEMQSPENTCSIIAQ